MPFVVANMDNLFNSETTNGNNLSSIDEVSEVLTYLYE